MGIKERKALFIRKGETTSKEVRTTGGKTDWSRWFDVEYVELEVLAGEMARWKRLLSA